MPPKFHAIQLNSFSKTGGQRPPHDIANFLNMRRSDMTTPNENMYFCKTKTYQGEFLIFENWVLQGEFFKICKIDPLRKIFLCKNGSENFFYFLIC